MEIRIGVRDVAREITLESSQKREEVEKLVTTALDNADGTLTLADEKGRTVVVPVSALGYVDIGAQEKGRVGFGTS